jgi:molybdenum cofactor cytidylyltransferase
MPEAAIGTVLLAAGRGTRFGPAPKLVADLAGKPLVRHAAEAALAARAGPVIVVLGAHAEAVRAALSGLDLALVENPDYAAGLSTSLRVGLSALPEAVIGALVLLGDMPRVTPAQLDRLVAAFAAADPLPAAVVPVHAGRRGNPVLLNRRRLAPDLARLDGDRGAGPILAGRADVLEIPGDAGTALDIDTPAALAGLGGG